MSFVDVVFPVRGEVLPTDHAYPLYTALSRVVPEFHREGESLFFAWINGQRGDKGQIRLFEKSGLRCRLPAERIPLLLPLAGKALDVGGHVIRLGVPRVAALAPAASLMAKMVTFKHSTEPGAFLKTARQKLDGQGVAGEIGIPLIQSGTRQGEPRRQVLRVKGQRVVGFAVVMTGLTAEESLTLQERGLGGRRRMGCGFFFPYRPRGT